MTYRTENTIRLDIQGLRAIAVLAVLFYHLNWISGGFVGVDIFFVVSGFVITSLILREVENTGRFGLLNFFARRTRRLFPILSLVIFITLLVSIFLESPSGDQQSTLKVALSGMFFGANIMIPRVEGNYFDAIQDDNPLLHIWSLSVEEQFYFAISICVFVLVRIRKKEVNNWIKRRFVKIFFILFCFSILSMFFLFLTSVKIPFFPNSEVATFYSPVTRGWEFLIGSLLNFFPKRLKNGTKVFQVLGVIGFTGIFICSLFDLSFGQSIIFYAPIVCICTAFVILAGSYDYFLLKPLIENRFLKWIGDRSYSIYLIHWPLIIFVGVIDSSLVSRIFICVSTIVMGHLSYIYVENKFRVKSTKIKFFDKYRTYLAWGTFLPTLVLSFIFYSGNQKGWNTDWALGSHSGIQRNCDVPPFKPDTCTWSNKNWDDTVLVVGDSQAWAISDGVIDAGFKTNKRVILGSYNNCPFVGSLEFSDASHCKTWQFDLLHWIREYKPEFVVIANATYGGRMNQDVAVKIVTAVEELNSKVVWLLNPATAPESLVRKSLLVPISNRNRSFERPTPSKNDLMIEKIFSDNYGIYVVNPSNFLCEANICNVSRNGKEFYTDGNHLSKSGAKLMTKKFVTIFSQ